MRLSQREQELLEIIVADLKAAYREADIERNGFVTVDPDSFVTRTIAMKHAIVCAAHEIIEAKAAAEVEAESQAGMRQGG